MFANSNAPIYMQMGGSARLTPVWIRRYAHELWEIIGIGNEPQV